MQASVYLLPVIVAGLLLMGLAFHLFIRRPGWEQPTAVKLAPRTPLSRGLLSGARIMILVMVFALLGAVFFHQFPLLWLALGGLLGAYALERVRAWLNLK
jgi:hypothetical protein